MTNLEMYQKYAQEIYRYSYFLLKNKEQAEDITSEAFLSFFEKTNIKIENPRAYLYGTARNLIYSKYRKVTPISLDNTQLSDEESHEIEVADSNYSVEQSAIDDQNLQIIKSCLENVDDQTKEVIMLRVWEEMQFNEISKILNENENSVKLRYYRGIEKIKMMVGERSYSKNLYSFSFPIVLAGIAKLSGMGELQASKGFVAALTSSVPSAGATGLFAATGAKIALLVASTVVVAGAATAAVVGIVNNKNSVPPISYPLVSAPIQLKPMEQVDKNNKLSLFQSSDGKVNFYYDPNEMGDASETQYQGAGITYSKITFSKSEVIFIRNFYSETWSSNIQIVESSDLVAKSGEVIHFSTLQGPNGLRIYGDYTTNRASGIAELIIETSKMTLDDIAKNLYFNQIKNIVSTLTIATNKIDTPAGYDWRSSKECNVSILEPQSDAISNPSSLDANRVWKFTSERSFNYSTNQEGYLVRMNYVPNTDILGSDYTSGIISATCQSDLYSGNINSFVDYFNQQPGFTERNGKVQAVKVQRWDTVAYDLVTIQQSTNFVVSTIVFKDGNLIEINKVSNTDNSDLKNIVDTIYSNIKFDGTLGKEYTADWANQNYKESISGKTVWSGVLPNKNVSVNTLGLIEGNMSMNYQIDNYKYNIILAYPLFDSGIATDIDQLANKDIIDTYKVQNGWDIDPTSTPKLNFDRDGFQIRIYSMSIKYNGTQNYVVRALIADSTQFIGGQYNPRMITLYSAQDFYDPYESETILQNIVKGLNLRP